MTYLLKLTPLEPFAFGMERGFRFSDVTENASYFVKSKELPEQTTVFGLVRYLILEKNGLIKSDFSYSEDEVIKIRECIGDNSFSFTGGDNKGFGVLKGISPIFIINEEGHYYVKNPFNNKSYPKKDGYNPIRLTREIETSNGIIKLPEEKGYDAKVGHGSGYINTTTGKVEDLFKTIVATGNRKTYKDGNIGTSEDSFFKQELKILQAGYSFGVFIEADELPESGVCYMGAKRSAFRYEVKLTENDLIERVKGFFESDKDKWFYALSDIYCSQVNYNNFCIIESKSIRNLETRLNKSKYVHKRKRSEKQFNLIESGSVFYNEFPFDNLNKGCNIAGYNVIIELGGN